MVWPIVAMAALGAAQSMQQQEKSKTERKQAAEMARWSPYTGMAPNQISSAPSLLQGAAQGAGTGAMMQGMMGGGGGAAAAAPAADAGQMNMADPAAQASMTGGQSAAAPPPGQYQGASTYNRQMAQKYPWAY